MSADITESQEDPRMIGRVVLRVIGLRWMIPRDLDAARGFHVGKMRPRNHRVLVDVGREWLAADGDEQMTRFLLKSHDRLVFRRKASRTTQHNQSEQRTDQYSCPCDYVLMGSS